MNNIKTKLNTRADDFRRNAELMGGLVADLRAKVALIKQGGGPIARKRHTDRGKLLPRDRIRALLDVGSPFLELSQLAAWEMYDNEIPSAGIITGIGRVHGQECLLVVNDATVKGGTYLSDGGEETPARPGDRGAEPFMWDMLPVDGGPKVSILRLDQLQPMGTHYNSYKLTGFKLSDSALEILDDLIHWLLWGGFPEDSDLLAYRELVQEFLP